MVARPLSAQTLGAPRAPGGSELPEWLTSWSPIGPTGDLGRDLPGQVAAPSLLTVPAPRTGSFWTAGNPAAVPWEVRDSYLQFRLGAREHDGDYRRPLDPGVDTRFGGSGFGWKRVGDTGAAIGRVTVDYLNQNDGAHADVVLPHGSNPFVMLDTLGDEVSAIVARLEGAGGWRLGNLGIGLGLGFDGRDVRTVRSPAPRQYRASTSGVSGGLEYGFAGGLVRVGTYGLWEQMSQSAGVRAGTAPSRVLLLRGYSDPNAIDVGGGATATYFRRFDRTANALGATVAGTSGGLTWTTYVQRTGATERQSVELVSEPPEDRWDADGWTGGVAAQFTPPGGLFLITLTGRYTRLNGEAARMDLDQPHFQTEESAWQLGAELRLTSYRGWSAALRVGTGRESRQRQDSLAQFGSDLKAWTPGVSIELARTLPAGFALSLGAGYAQHAPWGVVPDHLALSEGYADWIAPELSLYGTKADAFSWSATILWRESAALAVWARGTMSSVSGDSGIGQLPLAPEGSRTRVTLEVGITMRER